MTLMAGKYYVLNAQYLITLKHGKQRGNVGFVHFNIKQQPLQMK